MKMSNSTSCPYPPGGGVTCEDYQIAYCIIEKSEVNGGCYSSGDEDTPDEIKAEKFLAWIASEVTKDYSAEIYRQMKKIIKEQRYKSSDGEFEMHFSLPSRSRL